MLVIYNIQCKDDERIFFNITHQDIEPKNCTGTGGELVYVWILRETSESPQNKGQGFVFLSITVLTMPTSL